MHGMNVGRERWGCVGGRVKSVLERDENRIRGARIVIIFCGASICDTLDEVD